MIKKQSKKKAADKKAANKADVVTPPQIAS